MYRERFLLTFDVRFREAKNIELPIFRLELLESLVRVLQKITISCHDSIVDVRSGMPFSF